MALLSVRIIPRASKSAIAGRRGDAILVRVAAPPVDGAANQALIELLAKALAIPKRNISIVAGERSRDKRVSIAGISDAELSARVSDILHQT